MFILRQLIKYVLVLVFQVGYKASHLLQVQPGPRRYGRRARHCRGRVREGDEGGGRGGVSPRGEKHARVATRAP